MSCLLTRSYIMDTKFRNFVDNLVSKSESSVEIILSSLSDVVRRSYLRYHTLPVILDCLEEIKYEYSREEANAIKTMKTRLSSGGVPDDKNKEVVSNIINGEIFRKLRYVK